MFSSQNQTIVGSIQIEPEYQPLAVFLLGANGSGKSSLRSYLDLSNIQTNIDPDALNQIAKRCHRDNYLSYAARQAIDLFDHAIDHQLNVCMESTLSGKSAKKRIERAKNSGYYILAYFVGLNNVQLNIDRVARRVQMGGHDIARHLIIRRYQESIDNLIAIEPYIDKLHVIDNSQSHYALQFSKQGHNITPAPSMIDWGKTLMTRF